MFNECMPLCQRCGVIMCGEALKEEYKWTDKKIYHYCVFCTRNYESHFRKEGLEIKEIKDNRKYLLFTDYCAVLNYYGFNSIESNIARLHFGTYAFSYYKGLYFKIKADERVGI